MLALQRSCLTLLAFVFLSSQLLAQLPPGPPSASRYEQAINAMLTGDDNLPFRQLKLSPPGTTPASGECFIEAVGDLNPDLGGLFLYDPRAIRICNPILPDVFPPFWFGDRNECGLWADLQRGLRLYDPRAIRICNLLNPARPAPLWFGDLDLCGLEAIPDDGLRLYDITAIRFCNPIDPLLPGPPLFFDANDQCGIIADPAAGLVLRDPQCIRLLPPPGALPPVLYWGPTNDCSLGLDPNVPGLVERDPVGLVLLGGNDPTGVNNGRRVIFGNDPDDLCTIGIDPRFPGLSEQDPNGFRLLGELDPQGNPTRGCRLLFGPTDDCTVEVDPSGAQGDGLLLRDPRGIRLLNPDEDGLPQLIFGGPDNLCRIRIGPPGQELPGMIFEDPRDFLFQNRVLAPEFVTTGPSGRFKGRSFDSRSSRRWKENIQTISKPLDLIASLRGVTFDWKQEEGGQSSVGFIAEEVAEVVPELVTFEKDGKTAEGVQYSNITALLVEGMKEQQKQIEATEKAFHSVNARNVKLQVKLNQQVEDSKALSQEVAALRDQLDQLMAAVAENQ